MEDVLVSVIIPAYNSSNTIVSCLASVLSQSYSNIEVIVIDDGSSDDTLFVVQEFIESRRSSNVKVFSQINSGPSTARNFGITKASGDFIAFLDSDDEWYPTKLELIMRHFELFPEIDIIGSNYSIGNYQFCGNNTHDLRFLKPLNMLFKNCLITSATVCKKRVFSKLKFKESQKYSEDYRLWLELSFNNYRCAILNDCLVKMCDKPIYGASGLGGKIVEMEKGELDNFTYLYRNNYISFFYYFLASLFSLLKFIKRYVFTIFRKLVHNAILL